jgi:hypothetical protein
MFKSLNVQTFKRSNLQVLKFSSSRVYDATFAEHRHGIENQVFLALNI